MASYSALRNHRPIFEKIGQFFFCLYFTRQRLVKTGGRLPKGVLAQVPLITWRDLSQNPLNIEIQGMYNRNNRLGVFVVARPRHEYCWARARNDLRAWTLGFARAKGLISGLRRPDPFQDSSILPIFGCILEDSARCVCGTTLCLTPGDGCGRGDQT